VSKAFKNITFDQIKITGKVVEKLFFYPRSNVVFDEKGNDVGRYSVKNGELEAIVDYA